jgi:hypothetical protein
MEKVSYSGDQIGRRIFAKAKKLEGFEFKRRENQRSPTSDAMHSSEFGVPGSADGQNDLVHRIYNSHNAASITTYTS